MPIMFRFFRLVALSMALIALFYGHLARASEHPTIRVAIVKDIPQVTIRAARSSLMIKGGRGGEVIKRATSVSVRAVNDTLRVNGTPFPGQMITIEGSPALYYIDKNKFRGVLRVYLDEANRLQVINELDVEDYLAGLINSEISSSWPIEAVKAQAVAARTYALHQVAQKSRKVPNSRYDIESTVIDQVYKGAHREDRRAYEGVRATTGMVLTRGGIIFPSYYHSTCGGYTEHAHNVWAGMSGPPTVVDAYCRRSPHGEWFWRISKANFFSLLTRNGVLPAAKLVTGISQTPFPDSPRANEVILHLDRGKPIAIRATELRRMLGYNYLKSTWFNVGFEGDAVVFAGRGFGHGSGLCQWGAKGMAEAGHTYKEILKHYYSDAEIGHLY
jgi:stage II sporulation protein D